MENAARFAFTLPAQDVAGTLEMAIAHSFDVGQGMIVSPRPPGAETGRYIGQPRGSFVYPQVDSSHRHLLTYSFVPV